MLDLLYRMSRYCLPRSAEEVDGAFCADGLTHAQRWSRFLVCRSRSPRLVEWSGTDPGHVTTWSYAWPDESDGCPNPDSRPAQTRFCRKSIGRSGLAHALDAAADETSVLLLSGMENGQMRAGDVDRLRHVIGESRYAVLESGRAGVRDLAATMRFVEMVRDLGIPEALCSIVKIGDGDVACALGGHEALPCRKNLAPARVLAFMNTYNEADIIGESVAALLAQGLDLFVIDDGSTDGTAEILEKLAASNDRITLARHADPIRNQYDNDRLLQQKMEQARRAFLDGYTWMIFVDADEIRQSPWPDISLAQAFAHVEALGYNAVDFTVLDFRFLKDDFPGTGPFEKHMRYFEFGSRPGHFVQIKAWRHAAEREVDAIPSGGHNACFPGRRVFPLKFLLKHYPLRNPSQASRKIFQDRLPRYMPEAISKGKHIQYNHFRDQPPLGWDRGALHEWDEEFYSRYLIERLSGLGLPGNTWR